MPLLSKERSRDRPASDWLDFPEVAGNVLELRSVEKVQPPYTCNQIYSMLTNDFQERCTLPVHSLSFQQAGECIPPYVGNIRILQVQISSSCYNSLALIFSCFLLRKIFHLAMFHLKMIFTSLPPIEEFARLGMECKLSSFDLVAVYSRQLSNIKPFYPNKSLPSRLHPSKNEATPDFNVAPGFLVIVLPSFKAELGWHRRSSSSVPRAEIARSNNIMKITTIHISDKNDYFISAETFISSMETYQVSKSQSYSETPYP